jgi:hypothetical protein
MGAKPVQKKERGPKVRTTSVPNRCCWQIQNRYRPKNRFLGRWNFRQSNVVPAGGRYCVMAEVNLRCAHWKEQREYVAALRRPASRP